MICDNFEERKISCFVNGEKSGEILFESDEKLSYKNSFYWFGCGSMIGPEEHNAIGDFEYKLTFVLNKKLDK